MPEKRLDELLALYKKEVQPKEDKKAGKSYKIVGFYKETKFKKTEIGEIPEEWEVVELGKIAEIRRGASPRPKGDPRYFGGNIPWIKISDISKYKRGVYLLKTDDTVTEEGKKRSVYCPDGTLIVSNSGTIGEPAIIMTGKGGCIHDGFISVSPIKSVNKIFLYYFFEAKKNELLAKAQKGTQGNMNTKLWKRTKLSLPPLPEQWGIAQVLSTIDNAIQKSDELISKIERLKKGLMQELLTKGIGHTKFKKTEIGVIPEEWDVVKLKDACVKITDGSHFSPKEDPNGKFRIATVANMRENYIDISSCKRISKEDYELLVKNGCKPEIGDILFSKDGTVGITFAFKQDIDIVLLSSIAIIRPKKGLLDPDFGAYALKAPSVSWQIFGRKTGTALRRIVLKDLRNIKIPLPPLEEQQKIAKILSTVDKWLELERKRKEKLERLKKGLMNELLTGKTRVKVEVDGRT